MRILLLTDEYPPTSPGGIGTYTAAAASALRAAGHDVHVSVCRHDPDAPVGDHDDGGVHVHERRVPPWLRRLPGRLGGRVALAVSHRALARRLAKDGRLDAVEAPEWQAQGLGFTVGRTPLTVTLHTPDAVVRRFLGDRRAGRHLSDRLDAWVAARADAVSGPSQLLVDDLRRIGWLHRDDVSIVRTPIDHTTWAPTPLPEGPPRILGVGRLEARKGFDTLIEACGLLVAGATEDAPPPAVVIVGAETVAAGTAPTWSERLHTRAAALGVDLTLTPAMPYDELKQQYVAARCVVVPSRFDNFAYVAMEALAAGRAVVVSDAVGVAELDDGSGAVSVFPAGDATRLAHALRPLVEQPAVAAAGEHARALAVAHLAPTRFAELRVDDYRRADGRVAAR